MKELKYLVVHCTYTEPDFHVSKEQIIDWHTAPKPIGRGWSRVGYSDLIQQDGSIVMLHPYDSDNMVDAWEITNGVKYYNTMSRHIVYAGGKLRGRPADTRTPEQKKTLEIYLKYYGRRYENIKILGHRDFPNVAKDCPCFDVGLFCLDIGIPEKNIYGYSAD